MYTMGGYSERAQLMERARAGLVTIMVWIWSSVTPKLAEAGQEGLEDVAVSGAAPVLHLVVAIPVVGDHQVVDITPLDEGVDKLGAGFVQQVVLLADDVELDEATLVGQGL